MMDTSNIIRHTSEFTTHAVDSIIATAEAGTGGYTDGKECSFVVPHVDNVVHQRRRVNPESLALRLGPDLVRDLDALIKPGNTEMPSFAVRKELQERYNIDRRHIYDYFHSRGLRVVKEDKHGNPMTAKDLSTPLPNLRPLRQAPTKNFRSHPPYPVAAERKPRGVAKAKPGRPKKIPQVNPEISPIACETNESSGFTDINDALVPECPLVPTPTYVSVNPLFSQIPSCPPVEEDDSYTLNSIVNPLDESFSVRRAIGDIAYAYRHESVFERMQELTGYSAKLALSDDRLLSWNEGSPSSASSKGLLLPHAKPLTRDERQAIYESISDSLGPAHGIQECQGTYRKHMQARTKLYFEGLLSLPYHHSQQRSRTSTLSDQKPSLGTNEFRHWLSETRFLKRNGTNGSPRLHPSHRNANVAKQDIDEVINKQDEQIYIRHWMQTLDDLFPTSRDDLSCSDAITDSPVVHMQEVSRQTKRPTAQGIANERITGGQLPLSVAPSSSLPGVLPITSLTETQTDYYGLSGFPGIQQVKTRAFAEMEGHPQWPEHVSYVARSGRGAALSDTQRRSRNIPNTTRLRLPSCSPRKPQIHDLDRIWTRAVTSRDTRRRTPSAAGDI